MPHKKIDVITKYFYPVAGGIETNTYRVYRALVKSGWDVTVHTTRNTLTGKNVLPVKETIDGIKVVRYNFGSDFTGFWPNINLYRTDVVALHNFNVFYIHLLIKVLLLKSTGRKKFMLMLTPHGGFNPEWSMFSLPHRILKYVYHYFIGVPLINYCVDFIRAVSEWERVEMIKKGIATSKIKVIQNGLEDEAYTNNDKLASKTIREMVKKYGDYILQIARINPIKNFETVIQALPLIKSNVNYVIAGEDDDTKYKENITRLATQLNVNNRLFFAGVVRGHDKYYLIKNAKIMTHLAIWESFCNVVNEALSQGVVCIAANNTALKYLITKKTGFLVNTKDYRKLSKKINWIMENKNSPEIKIIRDNGIKIAKSMSWNQVAHEIENHLKLKVE